jgi:hypothetical protein
MKAAVVLCIDARAVATRKGGILCIGVPYDSRPDWLMCPHEEKQALLRSYDLLHAHGLARHVSNQCTACVFFTLLSHNLRYCLPMLIAHPSLTLLWCTHVVGIMFDLMESHTVCM